ncbi:MAG: lipoate--protein ligase [Prolixibacteraceae bacterium]
MTTHCLQLKDTDPYFNLAAEEYFLKSQADDFIMTWRSKSAVVVGKHQNALAEINHRYVRENQICVARRLSGGGTVFHDPGNLNFTFIRQVDQVDRINYSLFTQLMISILKKLQLDVYANQHNAIFLDQKKVSGSADHVHRRRVMHHGTLLFNSHLHQLRDALNVDLSRFDDKAIQSNRSEVVNLSGFLPSDMTMEKFSDFIFHQLVQTSTDHVVREITSQERQDIETLRDEKYCRWNWIYGYSPRYRYRNELPAAGKKVSFMLSVEKGIIKESAWMGDISARLAAMLTNALEGRNHDYEMLKQVIPGLETQLQNEGFSAELLLEKIL